MGNTPKPGTEEWDFMLDGALAFIKSGQYEQIFGKIGDKKTKDKEKDK